jgi:hypothetical protein
LYNAGLFEAANPLGDTGCGQTNAFSDCCERIAPALLQRLNDRAIEGI